MFAHNNNEKKDDNMNDNVTSKKFKNSKFKNSKSTQRMIYQCTMFDLSQLSKALQFVFFFKSPCYESKFRNKKSILEFKSFKIKSNI